MRIIIAITVLAANVSWAFAAAAPTGSTEGTRTKGSSALTTSAKSLPNRV